MFTYTKVSKSLLDAVNTITEDKTEEVELDEDGNCVTPPQAKGIAKKEVKKHETSMHGEKGEVAKHEKKMHKEELGFKDRLLEREMTKKEKAKRHEISGAMEKDPSYFKKKYGSRWKDVMYATATKKAMGEELEQVNEYHKVENEKEEISTDMLSGREQGQGKTNSFKNFKVKIEGSLKTAHEPEMEKAPDSKAKESIEFWYKKRDYYFIYTF